MAAAAPPPGRCVALSVVVASQAKRGHDLVLSGTFSGVRVAYLPTDRDLGVILEIFDGLPDAEQQSDATKS